MPKDSRLFYKEKKGLGSATRSIADNSTKIWLNAKTAHRLVTFNVTEQCAVFADKCRVISRTDTQKRVNEIQV